MVHAKHKSSNHSALHSNAHHYFAYKSQALEAVCKALAFMAEKHEGEKFALANANTFRCVKIAALNFKKLVNYKRRTNKTTRKRQWQNQDEKGKTTNGSY